MAAADVVEHTVELHPQAPAVRFGYQRVEVAGVAQARVDAEIVKGVVAVGGGAEDGSERDPGRAQLDRVVQPGDDAAEPVLVRSGRGGWERRVGADEPERVQPPPDRVADPRGLSVHRARRSAR
jgi:hypothetical protein